MKVWIHMRQREKEREREAVKVTEKIPFVVN